MSHTIRNILITILLPVIIAGFIMTQHQMIFNITGEEDTLPKISGTIQYLLTRLQPPLQTADDVPVKYTGVNPYGINTFLQNEVEPAKREQAMRLISEAGIKWIRQEFTWEDIEIHGKGDFEDRRHEPHKSAWQKYDQIVELAEKYDLKIMARLSNPPAWTRALTNTVGAFAPPDDYDDYGDFVEILARRYHGRISAYQIWNEPNIYPEWGEYPINADEYTELLKVGYTRIKKVDSDAIVVMGALAATIELDRQRSPISPGGLSDVLFLQQMYNAGAAPYFDVLAMQGYGLWSGPTDRRMQPRVLNFSRPLYVRDVMVRNGDAHKPIWLSELSWNAVPPESGIPPIYGQVTLEQQARYTAIAYQRLQQEWPWAGVGFYWFFKQADEREQATNPQYYFRMVEPDFSPMPVYETIKQQANQSPIMYQGFHEPSHWAVTYQGHWTPTEVVDSPFGEAIGSNQPGDSITLIFEGSSLELITGHSNGTLEIQSSDSSTEVGFNGNTKGVLLANKSSQITLTLIDGHVDIQGFVVENGW
jgi:hypothetical protein